MFKTVFTITAVLLLSSAGAMAQERAAAKACAADIKAQCAGVEPGEGRIRACVKEHFKDLSEPCQAILLKAREARRACAADAKQFCPDLKPGGGRIVACLEPHLADLSEPCKDALTRAAAGKN